MKTLLMTTALLLAPVAVHAECSINPLAWLLLPTLWRSRRGFVASRFIDGVIVLQLLALLAALALHLLPGTVQQNQPWLLFALPCWLALAWGLRRNR